jgi:Integrase core domain
LLRSGARFAANAVVLSAASDEATKIAVRRIGPALVFERLWEETGCRAVISDLAGARAHKFAVERAVFLTVLRHLGIEQVRTPFRAPRANAISERWVKSVRAECLDHLFIFNEAALRRVMASYVNYFNHWRPIDRLTNARRAIRRCSGLRARAARSSPRTSSADCITSIST